MSPRLRTLAVHGGLFLATCVTTTLAGGQVALEGGGAGFDLGRGLRFAAALLSILVAHEMGHFVVARRRGVAASLPFFIPLPFGPIGTLGAIIRMPLVRSRDALVDIGAAGPLAGLAMAIPILAFGLAQSDVGPIRPGGWVEGNSLLYFGLKFAIFGEALPGGGRDVFIGEIAFGGWVGLLVTMINLIPIGQLDGGHIAYGWFGAEHDRASRLLHRALVPLGLGVLLYVAREARAADADAPWAYGLQASMNWFVWALMLTVMRRLGGGVWHPPAGEEPLSAGRRRLCIFVLVVFLLIFIPIPFRTSL
ncbi:MAG: site-2 protease family protein [Myxococcota bacterium]